MRRKPRSVRVEVSSSAKGAAQRPVPWPLAAVVGSLAVALAGWLLVAGATAIAWVAAPNAVFASALRFGTEFWLLANGGDVRLDGLRVSVTPLGLSAVIVLLATGAAGFAAQQAKDAGVLDKRLVWWIIATFTGSYAACVVLGVVVTAQFDGLGRTLLGAVLIAGLSSTWQVHRVAGRDVREPWPVWARAIPRAVGASLLVVLVGAGIALATALLLSKDRVVALHDSLDPGVAGSILLLLVHIAWLPNMILWCASWVLGAGFSIGAGSIVTPTLTEAGLLPALPVFAAVPQPGPGSGTSLWWLVVGVVAGAVAAILIVRARPWSRLDETTLVGGLSGLVAGLVVTGACAISGGSFGADRLTVIGARLVELVIMAPTLLGIAGLVTGLVAALISRARRPMPQSSGASPEDEPTSPVDEDTTPVER